MWLPAKCEEYRFYFTVEEFSILFENAEGTLRDYILEWVKDPEILIRVYYKPGKSIWKPIPCYHLDDILRLMPALGLKISPEFRGEILAARESLPSDHHAREWKGL